MSGESGPDRYDPSVSHVPPAHPDPPPWPTVAVPARSAPSRWLAAASLGVALLAIGIAIGAWFRPLPKAEPPAAPTYSSQQVADAKGKVCAAYAKVHRALTLSAERSGGSDPTAVLAVATSGRQVLAVGSRYLISKLSEAPATPPDLGRATQKLANAYQELTIGYLDGLTNSDSELKLLLQESDEATSVIERLCE